LSWFPLSRAMMEESHEFSSLTPTEKLYFWRLLSEFNLRGEFYQSDLEMAKTLGTSEKTIRRGRKKLINLGWVIAKPGSRTTRNQLLATRYLLLQHAHPEKESFFAQMPRHTFNLMLDYLRRSIFKQADIVVYIYLSYWFLKNRGKYYERDRFYITKDRLRSYTNIGDAVQRIYKIYKEFSFSDGTHLFEYEDEYHRFVFKNWKVATNPEKSEQARKRAKEFINEVKQLVVEEKRKKLIKQKQKSTAIIKESHEGIAPTRDLKIIFDKLYKEKYGRWPNGRADEQFEKLTSTFGRDAVYKAIIYYFSADQVPNGSGAKTRTLGNFITHINEIVRLAHEAQHVEAFG
jgi:hypothetical protein